MTIVDSVSLNPGWDWYSMSSDPELDSSSTGSPSSAWAEVPDWSLGQDVINPLLKSAFSFADEHLTLDSNGFDLALGVGVKSGARLLEAFTAPIFGQAEPKALSSNFMQLGADFSSHPWAAVTDYLSHTDGEALATDGVLAAQTAFRWVTGGAVLKGGMKALSSAKEPGGESQDLSEPGNLRGSSGDYSRHVASSQYGRDVTLSSKNPAEPWFIEGQFSSGNGELRVFFRNQTTKPNSEFYSKLFQEGRFGEESVNSITTDLKPSSDFEVLSHNQEFRLLTDQISNGVSSEVAAQESSLGTMARQRGFTETNVERFPGDFWSGHVEDTFRVTFSKPGSL